MYIIQLIYRDFLKYKSDHFQVTTWDYHLTQLLLQRILYTLSPTIYKLHYQIVLHPACDGILVFLLLYNYDHLQST